MRRTTFEGLAFTTKKKLTRRDKFLAQVQRVVSWAALEAVIEPRYSMADRRGSQPKPLGAMLRIYFMQQWYALPDETTILNFRRLLKTYQLAGRMIN